MKYNFMNYILSSTLYGYVHRRLNSGSFKGTIDYWENRYKNGGTSGLGSYGELAEFKARIINEFIEKHGIKSLIEFGCGDGNQLALSKYPLYLGVDVSKSSVDLCQKIFCTDNNKAFLWYDPACIHNLHLFIKADATLSLDVIYHLIEDNIYKDYIINLFSFSNRYVIIYSSNEDIVSKVPHVRHRKFTPFVQANFPEFSLHKHIKNEYPDKSDFFIFEKKSV